LHGQILVFHDLAGLAFNHRQIRAPLCNAGELISEAITPIVTTVRSHAFPPMPTPTSPA